MSIGGYIRQDIVNKLLSNKGNIENVSDIIQEVKKTEPSISHKNINPYVYANRSSELLETTKFLEDSTQKLLLTGGIQGAGKSTLIRSLLAVCQEHVLIYWYECSKVTNLDDILLSLCAYFDKKNPKDKLSAKQKSLISVDERLINYLKHLDRPLIIALDSIEHLVNTDFIIDDDELKQFFNFLLTQEKVKLILIGQRLPTGDMEYVEDYITELRLTGLDESRALNLMRDNGLYASNTMLTELYKYSRGYPWVLLLAASISNKLNKPVDKMIQELSSYEDSFESYLIKNIYTELPLVEKKILDYLSVIRHPINIPTFMNLDNVFNDPVSYLEDLQQLKLIRSTGKRYHVNTTVRRYVYNDIPFDSKYDIHLVVSKFYANEMSKNLAERTIRLSRKLLSSEQFFHNNTATKFYTTKDQISKAKVSNIKKEYDPAQLLGTANYANLSDIKPVDSKIDKTWEALSSANTEVPEEVKQEDLDPSFKLPLPGEEKKELVNLDGLQIELSEEEKELIKDVDNEKSEKTNEKQEFFINPKNKEVPEVELEEEWKPLPEDPAKEILPEKLSEIDEIDLDLGLDDSDPDTVSSNVDLVESLIFVAKGYADDNKHSIALERYQEALDIAERCDSPEIFLKTLMLMADSYMKLKQYEQSIFCYEKSREIVSQFNDFTDLPVIITGIAKVYTECYQHEKALLHYNEVLTLPEEYLSNQVKANVYMGIGEIYDYRHQFSEALSNYFQALKAFDEINDSLNQAIIYSRIALIYDDLGQYEKAIKNYEQSLKHDRQLGRKQSYAATLANLAAVCDEIGQRSRSLKYYKQSLVIDKELNNFEGLYKTFSRMGTIYSEIGKTDKALLYYKQELKVAKKVKDPYWIAMAYLDLGDLFYFMDDYIKAAKYFFISQKVISKSISTDSKEKIERRIKKLLDHIPRDQLLLLKKQVLSK